MAECQNETDRRSTVLAMKLKQKRTLSVRTARSANADECTGSAFDPSDVALWWDPNMIRSNSAAIYVPVGNFPGWASEIGKKVHNMGWTIPGCILQDQGVILRVNALVVGPRDAYMLLISKYIETPPWEGAAQTSPFTASLAWLAMDRE
jgi:hypothetical protein